MQLTRRTGLKGLLAGAATAIAPAALVARAQDIVIGAPNALTGVFASLGSRGLWGMQIAVERINAQGGVKALGGVRLALIAADTTSDDAARAVAVTRRLIDRDGAVALIGAGVGAMTLAAQAEAERSEIPLVTNAFADGLVNRGYRFTFKIGPQGGALWNWAMASAEATWRAVKGLPPRSALIVMGDDAIGRVLVKSLAEQAKRLALAVPAPHTYRTGHADVSAMLAAAQRQRPDMIFLGGFPGDVVPIVKALRAAGVAAPIVVAGLAGTDTIGKALGPAADKVFTPMAWNWDLAVPGNRDLVAAYKAAHPDQPFPPANEQVGQGYVAAMILRQALEGAGSRDPRQIRDALARLEFTGLPYPNPIVRFGEKGLNAYNAAVLAEWINGELRTVWPKPHQTTPPML